MSRTIVIVDGSVEAIGPGKRQAWLSHVAECGSLAA